MVDGVSSVSVCRHACLGVHVSVWEREHAQKL